jgi:hypothetical protein
MVYFDGATRPCESEEGFRRGSPWLPRWQASKLQRDRPIRRARSLPSSRSPQVDRRKRLDASWPRACGHHVGQPVIIENAADANGSIGVGRVARAAPDGYTLSFGVWNAHVANGAIYALQYDVLTDFEPIALISSYPYLIAAKWRASE